MVEQFVLALLLGWLIACFFLTVSVTIVRRIRRTRVATRPITEDAAPFVPAVADAPSTP